MDRNKNLTGVLIPANCGFLQCALGAVASQNTLHFLAGGFLSPSSPFHPRLTVPGMSPSIHWISVPFVKAPHRMWTLPWAVWWTSTQQGILIFTELLPRASQLLASEMRGILRKGAGMFSGNYIQTPYLPLQSVMICLHYIKTKRSSDYTTRSKIRSVMKRIGVI